MAQEKKKLSIREALFGGSGQNGNAYRIIYLTIAMYLTDKGPEQYTILLYGDDEGAIFTNTLPAHSIMYSYSDEVDGPYIKITKSFMPGSSKAEIVLPKGYSFMSPSMPTVFAGMPVMAAPSVVAPVTAEQGMSNLTPEEYQAARMSTDDVIRMMNEQEAKVREAREAQGLTNSDAVDGQQESALSDDKPKEIKSQKAKKKDLSNVIPESDPFVATFDSDVLNDKISRFMEKHDKKPVVQQSAPVKEVDPRTIDEVKRETVEDEMERLNKNADHIRKIGEAADEDAAGGKDNK
jgi:hypothetical protein